MTPPGRAPAIMAPAAASAPSVDDRQLTTPTWPCRTPAYTHASPAQFAAPARASHATAPPSVSSGRPAATASGIANSSPAVTTQVRVDTTPMARDERAARSVATAHASAAPSPPSRVVTDGPRRAGAGGVRARGSG